MEALLPGPQQREARAPRLRGVGPRGTDRDALERFDPRAFNQRSHIGLDETADGIWAIHFNTVLPATFDERDYIITG